MKAVKEGSEVMAINNEEYPSENPSQAEAGDQENQCFGAKREHWKRAPLTVLTEVELVGLV